MDEERVVLLGCVQEKQSVNDASPYACKAGGKPVWYGSEAPVEAASLQCPRCKKHLYMVAQVYAPVDTDRTLYVFGCNSAECTEVAGSWRVVRDEAAPKDSSSEPLSMDSVEQVTTQMSAVNVASGWAATSGGEDSDWSDVDDDKQAEESCQLSGDIDLEKLLSERDAVMTLTKDAPSNVKSKATTEAVLTIPTSRALTTANAFRAMTIEVLDEPFEDYTSENDFSYENRLLQDYIKQEEEEESTDVNDLRRIISTAKKSTPATSSTAASSGESYEKTPASQKHFMRFQKRINRCPLQCLRYDYGGEPLWPVTIPQRLKIPACACGAERVFEFQLLPTINYFLKVDEIAAAAHATEESPDSEVSASSAAAIRGGMDWVSLMIYSCPQSCSRSREEVVFVLPPPKS